MARTTKVWSHLRGATVDLCRGDGVMLAPPPRRRRRDAIDAARRRKKGRRYTYVLNRPVKKPIPMYMNTNDSATVDSAAKISSAVV